MIELILILLGFVIVFGIVVLLHRTVLYLMFKDEINQVHKPNPLQDNNFRNTTERSGIVPGGVSWTELPEYLPKEPLSRRYPKWVATQHLKYQLKRKSGKWK